MKVKFVKTNCKICGGRKLAYASLKTYCYDCLIAKRKHNYIKNRNQCIVYAQKYQKNNKEIVRKCVSNWIQSRKGKKWYKVNDLTLKLYASFNYLYSLDK